MYVCFERGTARGVILELYVDSDCASKATTIGGVGWRSDVYGCLCLFLSRTQKTIALSFTTLRQSKLP